MVIILIHSEACQSDAGTDRGARAASAKAASRFGTSYGSSAERAHMTDKKNHGVGYHPSSKTS